MKKKSSFVILIIIILMNSASMLLRAVGNLDELWNYAFSQNICNGFLPYKDFNIIITPMYPAVVAIFLKVIGHEMLVYRITAIILFSAVVFIAFLIMKKTTNNKWISILATLAILIIYKDEYRGDYNMAVLLITVIVIWLEIIGNSKRKILDLNIKHDLLLGVAVGIAILTKQTTGIILALTFVMYKFLFVKNKIELKQVLRISLIRAAGVIIPCILFLVYLIITHSLNDFIDYSIIGISTFNNSFTYFELLTNKAMETIFKVIGVLFPIFTILDLIVLFKAKIDKTERENLVILFVFSLQNMIVMYPLCDSIHMLIGVLPLLITTVYCLYLIFRKFIKNNVEKIIKVLAILSMIACFVYSIDKLGLYINKQFINNPAYYNKLNHFYAVPMTEGMYNYNLTLEKYIKEQNEQEKDVYIIDIQAIVTMIYIDKHYKNYDMLVKGNLGAKGEDGIIEDIKNKENAVFLIQNGVSGNRQSPEKIKAYIKDNLNNTGKVSIFEIYEK